MRCTTLTLISLFLIGTSVAETIDDDNDCQQAFLQFRNQFQKHYESVEVERRRSAIFCDNLMYVNEHNAAAAAGLVSYSIGINQFADMLPDEFVKVHNKQRYLSYEPTLFIKDVSNVNIPPSVDWRDNGYVGPVPDQGQCGSSGIYSGCGAIESQQAVKVGKFAPVSIRQIEDCMPGGGCAGGASAYNVFEYVIKQGGIDSAGTYNNSFLSKCEYNDTNAIARIDHVVKVTAGDEQALAEALASTGPISVTIDASHFSFQLYTGGVYSDPACNPSRLDHETLLVGYGTTDKGEDYWLCRNSWGQSWGEAGYVKIARNQNNMCGIASYASYPVMK